MYGDALARQKQGVLLRRTTCACCRGIIVSPVCTMRLLFCFRLMKYYERIYVNGMRITVYMLGAV